MIRYVGLLWIRRTPPAETDLRWAVITLAPGRWEGDDAQGDKVIQAW
jgi:hypothetical protein